MKNKEVKGRVIYIFENTIDILRENGELLTLTFKPYASPYTINLSKENPAPRFFQEVFSQNMEINVRHINGALLVEENSGLRIIHENPVVYRPNIKTCNELVSGRNLVSLIGRARTHLAKIAGIFSEPFTEPSVEDAISGTWHIIHRNLKDGGSLSSIKKEITRYIGLGGGFTPAYDDYLSGLLAGTNSILTCTGEDPVIFSLSPYSDRTNIVSLKTIDYSMRLDVIEPVDDLLCCLLCGDGSALLEKIIGLISVGWSSGYYTARGVLDGAEAASLSIGLLGGRMLIHRP